MILKMKQKASNSEEIVQRRTASFVTERRNKLNSTWRREQIIAEVVEKIKNMEEFLNEKLYPAFEVRSLMNSSSPIENRAARFLEGHSLEIMVSATCVHDDNAVEVCQWRQSAENLRVALLNGFQPVRTWKGIVYPLYTKLHATDYLVHLSGIPGDLLSPDFALRYALNRKPHSTGLWSPDPSEAGFKQNHTK